MIRYLTHKEIDKQKWDNVISLSHNKLIYACSWYLDVVSPKWDALILNDYEAIMPLTHGKKYGYNYLYQPYFTQQLGVFSAKKINEKTVLEFTNAIPHHFKLIEININNIISYNGVEIELKENKNHELYLNYDYKKLYASFSDSTKRNIKKAEKQNINIDKKGEVEAIISLFKKDRGQYLKQMRSKHYRVLSQLTKVLGDKKAVHVWMATNNKGIPIAGAVFIEYFKRIIFLFSGNSLEGKTSGAMHYMINEMIKNKAGSDTIFDFEGSNDINLARFYKSFGSKESVYLQVRKNKLPKLIKWLKNK